MEHEAPSYDAMLHEPHFWVAAAFVVFIALAYKKVSAMLIGALDGRSAKIKAELDEAQRLRVEAQLVLQQYKEKQAGYLKEAETILADAVRDAATLREFSEKDLHSTLEARMKQAVDRIAQEESNAIAEVRNHVVDIALAAARALIVDHVSTLSTDELVKLAMTDIERKIH